MANLTVFYHPNDKAVLPEPLRVTLDGTQTFEVPKGKFKTIPLGSGSHRIEAYFPGFGGEYCGCVNEHILIDQDETYYIYKAPVVTSHPGKLRRVKSERSFRASAILSKILLALLLAAAVILAMLLNR